MIKVQLTMLKSTKQAELSIASYAYMSHYGEQTNVQQFFRHLRIEFLRICSSELMLGYHSGMRCHIIVNRALLAGETEIEFITCATCIFHL